MEFDLESLFDCDDEVDVIEGVPLGDIGRREFRNYDNRLVIETSRKMAPSSV